MQNNVENKIMDHSVHTILLTCQVTSYFPLSSILSCFYFWSDKNIFVKAVGMSDALRKMIISFTVRFNTFSLLQQQMQLKDLSFHYLNFNDYFPIKADRKQRPFVASFEFSQWQALKEMTKTFNKSAKGKKEMLSKSYTYLKQLYIVLLSDFKQFLTNFSFYLYVLAWT